MNLNGIWQFEIDHGDSGRERGLHERTLSSRILVPFCPESELSGVGYRDFMAAVWYRREFSLPREAAGKRLLLHFGAVDYRCEAWINGQSAGVHEGGYASLAFEITSLVRDGKNTLVVCAQDDQRHGRQPYGKQSERYHSHDCSYTRTTGIWQTVWLEWVPETFIRSVRMIPDTENGALYMDAQIDGPAHGWILSGRASFGDLEEGFAQAKADGNHARFCLRVKNRHLWGPGEPALYALRLTLQCDGCVMDQADSYFALRTLSFDGKKCLINGRSVFQRLVLDQGFYPDGIYTAPSDEALKKDILLSMAMGFNGARLHQKVFEQRFLYWADQLGYLCWGEMASWGIDPARPHTLGIFLREWLEVVQRDFNAPCIVGWCPYNETWNESNDGLRELTLQLTYRATRALDPSRPCIDTSGGLHTETDIYDVHDYEQDPAVFRARYASDVPLYDAFRGRQHYNGVAPVFVSEYGGTRWADSEAGWGYGRAPETEEEFLARYQGLTQALLDHSGHMGFCYTQLTDVEQEKNGLYTDRRQPKFPPDVIAEINRRPAAMEQQE